MSHAILEKKFAMMGARLRVSPVQRRDFRIDVRTDHHGEYFDLEVDSQTVEDLHALDVQPDERHLLLMARVRAAASNVQKQKFLCGHDERAWFVAAVPGDTASTVRTAMEALKPRWLSVRQAQLGIPFAQRNRRKNEAFIRQGEWFFIPAPELKVSGLSVLHNEPIRCGRGKPHMCEFLYRTGGELVYVSSEAPNGVTEAQFRKLARRQSDFRKSAWRSMRRNMETYVKGRIRHPDHRTILLPVWHRVVMNSEFQAPGMRNVAFLD
jgi:hypothetical protein